MNDAGAAFAAAVNLDLTERFSLGHELVFGAQR